MYHLVRGDFFNPIADPGWVTGGGEVLLRVLYQSLGTEDIG
jgi:hypothetical protein